MKTTVACVFVEGHVPFTAEYVVRLKSMVAKHLSREHDFVALTDRPELFEFVQTIKISKPLAGIFGWWSKLELFNPKIKQLQSGRCLYLDLDTLVIDKLDPIVDYVNDMLPQFALIPDGAPNFHGKGNRRTVKLFNSSVMVWNGGDFNQIYTEFKLDTTKYLWGDQDWIAKIFPYASIMPADWFPRISECTDGVPHKAKVILCKKPKNKEAAKGMSWVKEAWQ